MPRGDKLLNEYAAVLYDSGMYASVPKAVLAALVVSYASTGGDLLQSAEGTGKMLHNVADEWRILHEHGIVPQRPSKMAWDILRAGLDKASE